MDNVHNLLKLSQNQTFSCFLAYLPERKRIGDSVQRLPLYFSNFNMGSLAPPSDQLYEVQVGMSHYLPVIDLLASLLNLTYCTQYKKLCV